MSASVRRVQFVISGPFLLLLLLAAGSMMAGGWLFVHRPLPQAPAYYVNRTLTAVRNCSQCVAGDGKLKMPDEWKIGKTIEIPMGEQWWFAPVEDPAMPAKIDGVPMLAVHPARDNTKPWEGFDQRKVMLVVLQDVDGKWVIEHPVPPTPPPPAPAGSSSDTPPSPPAADSQPVSTQPQQP